MIYSCTQFRNEWQMLDLRLAEELDVVDKMLIVEGDYTFSGTPRALRLPTREQYLNIPKVEAVFHHFKKISTVNTWKNAREQRNALMRRFKDDDVIIWSDLDEVHRRQDIPRIVDRASKVGYVHIRQHNHCYKINYTGVGYWSQWHSSFAVTGRYLRTSGLTFDDLRREWSSKWREGARKDLKLEVIRTNGHHFSYLMSPSAIVKKLQSIAAKHYNRPRFTNRKHIIECIRKGHDVLMRGKGVMWKKVPVDDTYPTAILDNTEEWKRWLA